MMNIIVDVHGRHNKIASQLPSDERIFVALQGMMAKMVFEGFKKAGGARP